MDTQAFEDVWNFQQSWIQRPITTLAETIPCQLPKLARADYKWQSLFMSALNLKLIMIPTNHFKIGEPDNSQLHFSKLYLRIFWLINFKKSSEGWKRILPLYQLSKRKGSGSSSSSSSRVGCTNTH